MRRSALSARARETAATTREEKRAASLLLSHSTGSEPLLALVVQPGGCVPAHGVTMTLIDSRLAIAR